MQKKLYGLMAEFDTATDLVDAANRVREAGYTKTDAFSPFPLHEIDEALGIKRSILPVLVFFGGLTGLCLGIGLQVFVHYIDYPLNVGGRPMYSWPSFIPVTFEMTILFAALTAVLGMLALNGLPRPHHPVFSAEGFELASRNRFFLLILHYDPVFDADKAWRTLEGTQKLSLQEVPHP